MIALISGITNVIFLIGIIFYINWNNKKWESQDYLEIMNDKIFKNILSKLEEIEKKL